MAITERLKKPAPKWYRIMNRIWGPVENLVLTILLLAGHGEGSVQMIVYKLVSSTARQILEAVLVESQNDGEG